MHRHPRLADVVGINQVNSAVLLILAVLATELPHLIPILLELRSWEKTHSVEAMVAAHLANHGAELIDLKAFHYMLRQGRIVLLFDGFDELATRMTYDRAADHLDMVLQAVDDKAKIVLSSRSQHFRTDAQVLTALGERVGLLAQRRVMSIEEFSQDQIRRYLDNRYGADSDAAQRRLRLLNDTQGLLGLSQNPRMLSFIADLDDTRLRAVAESGHAISAALLYEEILSAWLSYEQQRSGGVHGAASGLTVSELWQAVTALAIRLWERNEQYLELEDLAEVAETLSALSEGQLTPHQTVHAVGSDSLLMRTEDGRLGMIHGSVVEWLVAKAIAHQLASGDTSLPIMARRPLSQLSVDCTISLWDPATGDRLHHLKGCRDWVWPMVFNSDGSLLATGDRSGTVRLWDVATGAVRHLLPFHTSHVWTARFQPEGSLLAIGDSGGTVRLWDSATGALRAELTEHSGSVYRLVFNPDSTQLATADHGGTVRLYDVEGGRLRHELAGHHAPIYTLDFHPEGGLLASGDTHGGVQLWELPSGRGTRLPTGRSGAIYWVRFSPGGDLLAIGGNDGVVRLWETTARRLRHELIGHKGSTWPLAFRPDGRQLATCSNDGTTRLWDPASGQCTHLLRGHGRRITSVVFDATGTSLATAGNDGVVRLWDPRTGCLQRKLTGLGDRLISAFFDPVSALIATPSNDGDLHLWNSESGGYERALDVDTDYIWAATFSPDGDIVATANDDTVQLWYRTTGRHVRTLGEHRGRVRSIAFNPDGDLLATGCDDSAVRLWDAGTGEHLHTLDAHTRRVWSVAFSPDGSQLASAGDDGTVRIWSLAGDPAPRVRMTLLGLAEGWAALGPDGRYKLAGTVAGEFWHVVGTCRFEPGDMDVYLPAVRQLPMGTEF